MKRRYYMSYGQRISKVRKDRQDNQCNVIMSEAQMDCVLSELYGDGWRNYPFESWAEPFKFMRKYVIECEERRSKQ